MLKKFEHISVLIIVIGIIFIFVKASAQPVPTESVPYARLDGISTIYKLALSDTTTSTTLWTYLEVNGQVRHDTLTSDTFPAGAGTTGTMNIQGSTLYSQTLFLPGDVVNVYGFQRNDDGTTGTIFKAPVNIIVEGQGNILFGVDALVRQKTP